MANAPSEEREFALGNSVVLREIFQCFSTKELLELSLVNKIWNQECRRVLSDMKKCIAVIGGNNNECLRAREFNNLMDHDKLAVNPFNGLWLTIGWLECEDCICRCGEFRMEDVYDNLLTMKIKYLKLRWLSGQERTDKCLLEKFILRFLAKSESLEDLHLIEAPAGILLKQGDWHKDEVQLPKLRTIKLGYNMDLRKDQFEDHRANFLEIVARAPNLEAFQNRLRLDVLGSLPLEKMHIIKNLEIVRFYQSLQEAELRLLWDKVRESKLKLDTLAIYRFVPLGNFTKERYLDALVSIIGASSESLRTMEPDCGATSALKAIAHRLPPLINVSKLNLNISTQADVRVTQQFQRWPLAPIFPNLTTVSIFCSTIIVLSFNTEGNGIFPWTKVTRVEVKCGEMGTVNLADLGLVFPNGRTLVMTPPSKRLDLVELQLHQIWFSWPSLERLIYRGELNLGTIPDMDAAFCGISTEEAKFLREKDEEYLKTVNIVPIQTAINCHKGLKSLRFELESYSTFCHHGHSPSPAATGLFFLSKVTVLLALRHMPHLDFQVRIDPKHAHHLAHLEPFVKAHPATPD